jgi:hypothetical protein
MRRCHLIAEYLIKSKAKVTTEEQRCQKTRKKRSQRIFSGIKEEESEIKIMHRCRVVARFVRQRLLTAHKITSQPRNYESEY